MHWAVVALVACGGGGGFPDASQPAPAPPGSFAVDWSITSNGSAATCAEAGASTVLVLITAQPSGARSSVAFECDLLGGVSGALFPGNYDLAFSLDAGSASLGSAAPQTGIAVQSNQTTRTAPVVFALP